MYWLCPLLNSLRVTAISPGLLPGGRLVERRLPSSARTLSSVRSGSCKTKVTVAKPAGARLRVPLKITSFIRDPRNDLADCSPSTQLIESQMLDLPQPFGPTTAAMPVPANRSRSRLANDLKPKISICLSLNMATAWALARLRSGPTERDRLNVLATLAARLPNRLAAWQLPKA